MTDDVGDLADGVKTIVTRIDRMERLMLICLTILFGSTTTGAALIEKVGALFS